MIKGKVAEQKRLLKEMMVDLHFTKVNLPENQTAYVIEKPCSNNRSKKLYCILQNRNGQAPEQNKELVLVRMLRIPTMELASEKSYDSVVEAFKDMGMFD